MRPVYESQSDIDYEKHVADVFANRHRMDWVRNPSKYPIDISFMRGDSIVLFGEIKCRKVNKDTYPTYMISVSKIMAARALTNATGVECLLIVKWKDNCGWINLNKDPDSVGFGGRVDRNDNQDLEPVAYYEISRFKGF